MIPSRNESHNSARSEPIAQGVTFEQKEITARIDAGRKTRLGCKYYIAACGVVRPKLKEVSILKVLVSVLPRDTQEHE
jgi:hypothetical protein